MIDQITPLILTYNEAPNIGRSLEQLHWARDIVVVDSFSDDETLNIVSKSPNARVFQRAFDSFAAQWQFALNETGISTEWVLGLDADFILAPALVDELRMLRPSANDGGYQARLIYCVQGKPLRSSLLPSLTVLYRRTARYSPDGHTYRIVLDGSVGMLRSSILHDDRKPLSRWLEAQHKYIALEGEKILASDRHKLNFPDRIRRLRIVAPLAVFLYCLVFRGGILDGWPGLYYAFQRMFAELLLSLYLIEHDLKFPGKSSPVKVQAREREQPHAKTPVAVAKQPDVIL